MVEMFSSILSNYKSKIRNPFFGTLASVWLVRNWSIVYAIFNFDKECTMQDKVNYIQDYFNHKDYWNEFWINIGISFAILIVTYILLGFSRGLTDLYYKVIEPWIITFMDKSAIYTKTEKTRLEGRISLLEKKLLKSESDLTSHISEIEKANKEFNEMSSEKDAEIENLELDIDKLTESNEIDASVSNELNKYFDGLKIGNAQLDLMDILENKEIKKIISPGNHSQAYSQLINTGLVSNIDDNLKLTTLGKLYLAMWKNKLNTDRPKVML